MSRLFELPKSFFGLASTSIVGRHDTGVEEALVSSDRDSLRLEREPIVRPETREYDKPAFQYRPTNPSILEGFDNLDVSSQFDETVKKTSTSIFLDPGCSIGHLPTAGSTRSSDFGSTSQSVSLRKKGSSARESTSATNPYGSVIESRQNAMTLAFLRNRTSSTSACLSRFSAPEDFG